jgi:serine phosphatase RsbU (regulator of sigma subunit)
MSPRRPRHPRRPRGPAGDLAVTLGNAVLVAVPFALFFWVKSGGRAAALPVLYLAALAFAVVIGLCIWATRHLVMPRLAPPAGSGRPAPLPLTVGAYGATALLGSFAAALLVHATLLHGLLGTARGVIVFASYSVIFIALFLGLALAADFYRRVEARARADQELVLARRIQTAFLPTEFPMPPVFDVHAVNVASRDVSGDFYDVVPAGDGAVLLAIADVSGKGVPAALLTSMLQASLRTQAAGTTSPAAILAAIDTLLLQQHAVGRFATFFLGRLEAARGRLTYCNAGHNPPLLCRRGGALESLEAGGTVVGILPEQHRDEGVTELGGGDRLVCFTDGITEAMGPDGGMFGDDRLQATLRGIAPDLPSREVAARLLAQVDRFTGGAEPDDDRTLLVLRVREADPS